MVAAIADLIAFLLSFLFIFSFKTLSVFGGCALLPPTVCGARAALLPVFIRGTLAAALPVPQLSADVILPDNGFGPFGCNLCECTASTTLFIRSGLDKIADIIKSSDVHAFDDLSMSMILSTLLDIVSGVPKKKHELMEIKMSGEIEKDIEYAREVFGKEIRAGDVFEEGDFVDVTAVTRGKGTQGPVKRWGVMIQDAKARRSGRGRHVGSIGAWTPRRVRWKIPQLGQTGYQQRTEYNKRVFKIGENGEEITPKGGFMKYGMVRKGYILLKGSVPGPKKRLVRISHSIRPHPKQTIPEIIYISKESQQ